MKQMKIGWQQGALWRAELTTETVKRELFYLSGDRAFFQRSEALLYDDVSILNVHQSNEKKDQ